MGSGGSRKDRWRIGHGACAEPRSSQRRAAVGHGERADGLGPPELRGRLVPGEDLRGKRVCFTGELQGRIEGAPVTRAVAQQLAAQAGLIVANSVTKKLDLLVAADANTLSSKGGKAREYGIRIVAEPAFWRMLGIAAA